MQPFIRFASALRRAQSTATAVALLCVLSGLAGAPSFAQTVRCRVTSLGASIIAGYYMPGVISPYALTDQITTNDPAVVGAQASGQGLWWVISTNTSMAGGAPVELPPASFSGPNSPMLVTLFPPAGYNLSVARGAGLSSGFFVGYGLSGLGANPVFTACYWGGGPTQRQSTALGPLVTGNSTRAYGMADLSVTDVNFNTSFFALAVGQASQGGSKNDTAVFWRIAKNPMSVPRADAAPTILPPLDANKYCAAFGTGAGPSPGGPVALAVGEMDRAAPISQRHAAVWELGGLNPDPTQPTGAIPAPIDLQQGIITASPAGFPANAGTTPKLLSSSAYSVATQADGTIWIAGSATFLTRVTKQILGFRNPVTVNVSLPVAVLWTKAPGAAAYTAMFPLGGASAPSVARSVNTKGQLVGYMASTTTGTTGFLWDSTSGTQTIMPDTASGTKWLVTDVQAINNNGQMIGTSAYRNSTNIYGILLTPNPTDAMP